MIQLLLENLKEHHIQPRITSPAKLLKSMMVNYFQIYLKSQNTVSLALFVKKVGKYVLTKMKGNQGKEYMRPGEELIQCRKEAEGSL